MGGSKIFSGWLTKCALTAAAGAIIASIAVPANAATLRKTTSSAAADNPAAAGSNPGNVLYGYFDVHEPTYIHNGTGDGQNVMRLINTTAQDMCALIYVFDDDEELGECCGCPLTANELLSFGIGRGPGPNDLTYNWRDASNDVGNGVVAVIGATALAGCTTNGSPSNGSTPNYACNAGCDPTIHFQTGVLVQGTQSGQGLNGNIVHNQQIGNAEGILEVDMFDDSPGDARNTVANLQDLCKNNVQRGSGRGWCSCPGELQLIRQ